MSMPTENTALLPKDSVNHFSQHFPVSIVGEMIGARDLQITRRHIEPYCIIQFGSKMLHRTKPLLNKDVISYCSPIWTIKESCLFLLDMNATDIRNNKALVVTVWGRLSSGKLKKNQTPIGLFLGKIRIKASAVLEFCTEERIELDLVDEMGRTMPGTETPKLAIRFRLASQADVKFVQAWNEATQSQDHVIPRSILSGTGVLTQENRLRATLVTELEDWQVLPGSNLGMAILKSVKSAPSPRGKIRVKPCPDPDQLPPVSVQYMERAELKAAVDQQSRSWIEAGSGNLGRIFLEILSCHHLPNVDYGSTVGNKTDAFVSAVFGDAMAQTCVIHDELSPHWPSWTQRAFCFAIRHPSQVLFLAVFGFKHGTMMNHVPVGRVEICPFNFQRGTEYHLEYALSRSSHVVDREVRGTIRIRLRIEVDSERAALLAALKPSPPVYVNVRNKKSLKVARYTCCGEYDNQEKFNLKVLLAYIDEIKDSFLRRILYAINDGGQSLIFWRGQVNVGCCRLPLHSFTLFCSALLVVERPQLVPSFIFLLAAYFMLLRMYIRRQSPSPWYRCFSFGHYLWVLLLDTPSTEYQGIDPSEGWEEQERINTAIRKRIADDDVFLKKKEAAEKEIEMVESIAVETKSSAAVIPVELLLILGKVQGIVGGFVRICRSVDVVVTWEASDHAFWISFTFICVGVVSLFIPWFFLLKWTMRCAVVLLLGPQNKLIDLFLMEQSDDKKVRQMLEQRMFRARCHQEDAGKLKAFRHVLYGKFSTAVPTILWTPHIDRPLPESYANMLPTEAANLCGSDPYIPGQNLYGLMIPRPHKEWLSNVAEVERAKLALNATSPILDRSAESIRVDEEDVEDDGLEIDVETGMGETRRLRVPSQHISEDSLTGDWGTEVTELFEEEAIFVQRTWGESAHGPTSDELMDFSVSDDETLGDGASVTNSVTIASYDQNFVETVQRGLVAMQAERGKSQRELGVETIRLSKDEDSVDDNVDRVVKSAQDVSTKLPASGVSIEKAEQVGENEEKDRESSAERQTATLLTTEVILSESHDDLGVEIIAPAY